jgi:hypothetical protein
MAKPGDNKKAKPGRPRVNSTFVGVRLKPDQLARLDAWRTSQGETLGRPEAMRRLLERALRASMTPPHRPGAPKGASLRHIPRHTEQQTRELIRSILGDEVAAVDAPPEGWEALAASAVEQAPAATAGTELRRSPPAGPAPQGFGQFVRKLGFGKP